MQACLPRSRPSIPADEWRRAVQKPQARHRGPRSRTPRRGSPATTAPGDGRRMPSDSLSHAFRPPGAPMPRRRPVLARPCPRRSARKAGRKGAATSSQVVRRLSASHKDRRAPRPIHLLRFPPAFTDVNLSPPAPRLTRPDINPWARRVIRVESLAEVRRLAALPADAAGTSADRAAANHRLPPSQGHRRSVSTACPTSKPPEPPYHCCREQA